MTISNAAWKAFLGLGILVSISGAIFLWFAYAVFGAGDCNPCGQPPPWLWEPLLFGALFVVFGLLLRFRARS